MNNLITRAITGAVFVGVLLGSVFFDPLASKIVFGIFLLAGLVEFYSLFKNNPTITPSAFYGVLSGISIYTLIILKGYLPFILPSVMIGMLLLFLLLVSEIWRKQPNPLLNSGIHLFGVFYLIIPFLLVSVLSQREMANFPIVAGMLILIWTNDTFAYLTGRFVGKTKLFERISPKKTWEGTIGGIFFTVGAGLLIGYLTENMMYWIVAAIIVAPCAIFGDLLESTYKRSLNVKDSGTILPGHGGILDRFDATLFTIPFFFVWNTVYFLYLN